MADYWMDVDTRCAIQVTQPAQSNPRDFRRSSPIHGRVEAGLRLALDVAPGQAELRVAV